MELVTLIEAGSPVLVLGMLLFLERIHTKIIAIQEDVSEIKTCITWKETCHERHDDVDRRLVNLERNSGLNGNR